MIGFVIHRPRKVQPRNPKRAEFVRHLIITKFIAVDIVLRENIA